MKKNKKTAGIIYSVKNEVTGEFYIGATTHSLNQRKLDHLERVNRGEKGKFYEAISTYGKDAFSWEQIYTTTSTHELAQKEKEYILDYNSKEDGYNGDSGGSGIKRTVYKYDISDGALIEKFSGLDEAAKSINSSKQHIGRACLSVNNMYGGYYWSYEFKEPFRPDKDSRKKVVLYYNLVDGEELEFESVSEASRRTGVSKSCIARFCRGERKPPEGYRWEYK